MYLRFPVRIRGVAAGLAVLTVAPVVAVGGAHAARHGSVAQAGAGQVASTQSFDSHSRLIAVRDPSLSHQDPDPTAAPPAPTVAPTPEPAKTPRPTPKAVAAPPAPAAAPVVPAGSIQDIIVQAANAHGVSSSWMLKIARCESGDNPRAYNPSGPYIGLFQFAPSTFRAHGGTDIYDPVQQSNITASMLAAGQASQWSCA